MPLVGGEGGKEERQPTNMIAIAPLVKEAFPLVSACSCSLPLLTVYSTQKTAKSKDTHQCAARTKHPKPPCEPWATIRVLLASVYSIKTVCLGQKGGLGFSGTSCWPSPLGYLYTGSGGSHDTLWSHFWLRNVAGDVTIRAEKGRRVLTPLNHQRKQMLGMLMPWLSSLWMGYYDQGVLFAILSSSHPHQLSLQHQGMSEVKKSTGPGEGLCVPLDNVSLNKIWKPDCTLNYNKCEVVEAVGLD